MPDPLRRKLTADEQHAAALRLLVVLLLIVAVMLASAVRCEVATGPPGW